MDEAAGSGPGDAGPADWRADRTLDVRGLLCPLPVLKARKLLKAMHSGERLLIEATDPMAAVDIPHFCNESGHRLVASERGPEVARYLVERI